MTNFMNLAKQRYSVKNYSDKPVEEEKLLSVLEAARIAPTAKNAQSERIYVLQSDAAIAMVDKLTPCRYHAPVVLLFAYDKNEAYTYPESDLNSGAEDCSIAAVHVMFEALEQGLGTCWVNRFTPAKAKELFHLPEEQEPVLLMPIGYPSDLAKPLPNHNKKKAMEEIIKRI